jgi:hypothetical protein
MGLPGGGMGLPNLSGIPLKWLIIGGLLLLCIFVVLPMIFGGSDGGSFLDNLPAVDDQTTGQQPGVVEPTDEPAVVQPTLSFPTGTGEDTWLVMLYQDADDKILEQDIFVDLNEAERVGSGGDVQIVAQLDRYQAGYTGDGDWVSARRYTCARRATNPSTQRW